jgi:hypothetical protein
MTDLKPMTFEQFAKTASDRKLRLFSCACALWMWDGTPCTCFYKANFEDTPIPLPNCQRCHGSGRIGSLTDPRSRVAVEVAERYADGLATDSEMLDTWTAVFDKAPQSPDGVLPDIDSLCCRINDHLWPVMIDQWLRNTPDCPAASIIADLMGPTRECTECSGKGTLFLGSATDDEDELYNCPACHGAGLVPVPMTLCGAHHKMRVGGIKWEQGQSTPIATHDFCEACTQIVAWNDGTVRNLAQRIYNERDWLLMPVLADALEDAGYENMTVLEHLRTDDGECPECAYNREQTDFAKLKRLYEHQCGGFGRLPAQHWRGCWVLDLIRGKE